MRLIFSAACLAIVTAQLFAAPARASDQLAECKAFFAKLDKCVDALEGEQQQSARVFVRTVKATLGMADDLNQGDPMYTGIMCRFTMDELKKDATVKQYNCQW